MEWLKDKKILVLSLVDLEHCGFNHDDLEGELFLHGIDDPDARWPLMIAVDFTGGAIRTPDTKEETLTLMKQAEMEFEEYMTKLTGLKRYAILRCPICGDEQKREFRMYLFSTLPDSHPMMCGSGECPSHTVMKLVGTVERDEQSMG